VSDETKIARVYAEALFEAASESGTVQEVRRDLLDFAEALKTSSQLRTFFFDEEIPGTGKSALLADLTAGAEPVMRNFLRILAEKDREFIVEEVVPVYLQLVEQAAGIIKVELTTALPLPAELAGEIKGHLEVSLNKPIDLTLSVDEYIIGGVRLRIGDKVADASVRHRLDKLRALLAKPMANLEVSVEAAP
jgi:ATP synthase F1 delta subunit